MEMQIIVNDDDSVLQKLNPNHQNHFLMREVQLLVERTASDNLLQV